MKSKYSKIFLNILIIVLILFLIIFLSVKDNFNEVINRLGTFNIIWLLVSIILMILYWIFKALCLYETTKLVKPDIKFSKCLKIIIVTAFFNGITPFSSGGQPGQIYLITKEKIKVSTATNISLQNFILYQAVLVFLGLIALIINNSLNLLTSNIILEKLIVIGFIANTSVLVILFILSFCKGINIKIINLWIRLLSKLKIIKNKEKTLEKIEKTTHNFYESAILLKDNKTIVVKGLVYNFLGLLFLYSIPLVVFYGLGDYINLSFVESVVTTAYTMIIGAFVPIPGGSGGLEYAFNELFLNFNTDIFVTSAMLVWRFITYYMPLIVGGILLIVYKRGEKK